MTKDPDLVQLDGVGDFIVRAFMVYPPPSPPDWLTNG
jgi:hypothetical protein